MTIEQITDHAEKAKDRLPRFLDGATNFNALIDIMGVRTQGIETELFNLLDQRYLAIAVGAQLDGLGQILNLEREIGQSDSDYRFDLIAETGKLALSGQIESLILLFKTITFAVSLDLVEFYPASVLLTAFYDADEQDALLDSNIIEAMNEVKAAGVHLDLRFAEETEYLELSDVSEVDGSNNGPIDSIHGLGDEALLEGGGLSRSLYNFSITNEILFSQEFDNAVWPSFSGLVVTPNVDTAPDGTLTMYQVEDVNAAAQSGFDQQITDFDSLSFYCISLHVKKDLIPRATRFLMLRLVFFGSTNEFNELHFDTSTGEFNTSISSTEGLIGAIDLGDHWRFYMSLKSSDSGNTVGRFDFFAAAGASATWVLSNAAVGSSVIWGAQTRKGIYPGPYVKTEANKVTRDF